MKNILTFFLIRSVVHASMTTHTSINRDFIASISILCDWRVDVRVDRTTDRMQMNTEW